MRKQTNRDPRTDIRKTVAEVGNEPQQDHFKDGVSNGGTVEIFSFILLDETHNTAGP